MGVGELRIRGRVLRDTEPVEGAYVTLNSGDEFIAERRTGSDGVYEFHTTPGEWTLNVRAAGSNGVTRQINEAHGGEREEDFDLGSGAG
ncbi:MAG: DUF1416 domain-containing protein [Actinobacteria bacterium]|nr:DUF1416 domain-containing protein [Actinomycetota bacterium]